MKLLSSPLARLSLLALLAFSIASTPLRAQEGHTPAAEAHGAPAGESHGEASHNDLTTWKWIDFAVLAAGLAYLVIKTAGPYFRSQNEAIRTGIEDARRVKAESDAKVARIEQRLKNLDQEIQAFRTESTQLVAREADRLKQETAQTMARLEAQTASEIASLGKAARAQLKAEVAGLAIEIARQRLAAGIPAETQSGLINRFVGHLKKVAA